MFESKVVIKPEFSTCDHPGFDVERVKFTDQGEILLISNDEKQFRIYLYTGEGVLRTAYIFDNIFGQLVNIFTHKGLILLEFHEILAPYEEEYHLVKLTAVPELIFTAIRESYMHELPYHSLYLSGGRIYLSLIRHNRLHYMQINPAEGKVTELDLVEGGKWYLYNSYALCLVGHTLEVYGPELSAPATLDYDYEIDDLLAGESAGGEFAAFALSDINQEHTALVVLHKDTKMLSATYMEGGVADMGVSAGRIWINPYGFNMQQDMGGCVIYDKFAAPLYIHTRAKNAQNGTFGGYPPPFHRTSGIFSTKDGTTLVLEEGRALLFDYAGRAVKEWNDGEVAAAAVNEDGSAFAMLKLNEPLTPVDGTAVHKNATLEIYRWESAYKDPKVVEMIRPR